MLPTLDEVILKLIKCCESEVSTLAEIHKTIIQNKYKCNIEELRQRILLLHRDGYLGKEITADGINMYYIIFSPDDVVDTSAT